jgi:hypothetical protein
MERTICMINAAESFLATDSISARQEIPCLCWNRNIYHSVHNTPAMDSVSCFLNPGHSLISLIFNI